MKTYIYFLNLIILMLTISCEKNKNLKENYEIKTMTIIRDIDTFLLSFNYQNNLVSKIEIFKNEIVFRTYDYNYDNENMLIEKIVKTEVKSGIANLIYQNNKILYTENWDNYKDSIVYYLTDNGKVDKADRYDPSLDSWILASNINFNWDNNNCVSMTSVFSETDTVKLNITYDSKNNPLYIYPELPIIIEDFLDYELIPISENNVLFQSFTSTSDNSLSYDREYNYEYNDDEYPVKIEIDKRVKEIHDFDTKTIIIFEY